MPLSLLVAGHEHLFVVASLWYAVLAAELAAIVVLYLITARRHRPQDVGPLTLVGVVGASVLALELADAVARDRGEPGLDRRMRGAGAADLTSALASS